MIKKILSLLIILSLFISNSSFAFAESTDLNMEQDIEQIISASARNDLAYGGGDAEMDIMFDDIITKIKEYKTNNPKASEKKLDEYTNSLLKGAVKKDKNKDASSGEVQASYTDMDGYLSGYLNTLEQKLYDSNKTKALLCMANGKLALQYAEDNYVSTVLHNGNGDAFRHCLWNYGMAIDVGQTFAKQWSDAHENGTPNNPPLEKQMDLFNNAVGLQLAKDNPWTIFHSTFISKSKEKCRSGQLRIISNNKLVVSSSVGEK